MFDIADTVRFSNGFAKVGTDALQEGAPILCDGRMTEAGIIRSTLPGNNEVITTIHANGIHERAKNERNTRSAAAVSLWRPHLDGAIVAIGNAPTALFRLLELIDEVKLRPALILGFPVGFVGAKESKEALWRNSRGVPYLTLPGFRGGSAMAAAAVNALCAGAAKQIRPPKSAERTNIGNGTRT